MNNQASQSKRSTSLGKAIEKEASRDSSQRATWVQNRGEVAVDWKKALARHAATHLIEYGFVVQMGPGTTFSMLMGEIVAHQVDTRKSLDLIILTTNLEVMARGRDEREKHVEILESMQIILTGGSLLGSLDSLVGPSAVEGIRADKIRPDVVFFGAKGLSFDNDLSIRYHFDGELASQEAYATRPTDTRVLLCDHTKLAHEGAWKAEITIHSALASAERFLIYTTYPIEKVEECRRVDEQAKAFSNLLDKLVKDERLYGKDVALRLINCDGEVVKELSLAERRNEIAAQISGDPESSTTNGQSLHLTRPDGIQKPSLSHLRP